MFAIILGSGPQELIEEIWYVCHYIRKLGVGGHPFFKAVDSEWKDLSHYKSYNVKSRMNTCDFQRLDFPCVPILGDGPRVFNSLKLI